MKGIFAKEIEESEQLIIKGKYDRALEKITVIRNKENASTEEKIQCKILKARIHLETYPYSEVIKNAEEAFSESKKLNNKELMFDSLIGLPIAYFRADEDELRQERVNLMQQVLDSFEDKNSDEYLKRKAKFLLMKEGNYSRSLDNIEESLDISKKLGLEIQITDAYSELCASFIWSGELNKAQIYAQRSLELAEKLEYFYTLCNALFMLAVIHLHKGELNEAQDYYLKSISVFEETGDPYSFAGTYLDLGYLCWLKRDLSRALNYYQKSLNYFKEAKIVGTRHYPWTLFRMNLVLIELERYEEAFRNLEQIELLYILKNKPVFKKIYYLAKSVLIKTQLKTSWKEIISLLEEVADDPIVHLELNGWIIFHLCDAYLKEFQESNDLELYSKLKTRVYNLVQMAEQQNSYILLTQSLLLQSKLELIDLNIDKGLSLLERAQFLAEEKGISNLARLMSNEIDLLLDQLSKWEDMSSYLPSLEERLGFTHIEELLVRLVKNNLAYLDVLDEKESPLFFLILNKEGTILFSEPLSEVKLDSSTIQEVMIFIQDVISEKDFKRSTIKRLKHKKYTFALNGQNEMLFVYVFIGRSYYAVKKLKTLIEEFQSFSKVWEDLTEKIQSNESLNLEDRTEMSKYLDNLFSN